jgi:pyridoxine 4-dehydrogenase
MNELGIILIACSPMGKGSVPIPGAKNARQVQENVGALGWSLTESEVAALDAMSDKVTAR